MKKKIALTILLVVLTASFSFAAGNGNGGADKIGGYFGWPTGLSYSHEFNNLVDLDLLVGWDGFGLGWGGLNIQLGALFTVYDPTIAEFGNQKCPLSLGPVLGTSLWLLGGWGGASLQVFCPVRWEMNFAKVPELNVFLDWSPLGFQVNFAGGSYSSVSYASRGGVGVRYRIP